ncbi:predicted protein [Botrytis cinerea T4]|uniref:Uncharacterized protein n=1 Tax=Botryotinia fuckeliana (strain T4) TaxID=999810 RepID=G2XYK0_BOTF4|nr:predicted protein [Botrytis cinerea T4]
MRLRDLKGVKGRVFPPSRTTAKKSGKPMYADIVVAVPPGRLEFP